MTLGNPIQLPQPTQKKNKKKVKHTKTYNYNFPFLYLNALKGAHVRSKLLINQRLRIAFLSSQRSSSSGKSERKFKN